MPAPTSLHGFDVAPTVDRMLGQPELWWQAVGLFVEHFAEWEPAWLATRGDDAAECRQVHALRSAAANVGASHLSCVATVLEELLSIRLAGRPVPVPASLRWYLQDCFREVWQSAAEARLGDCLPAARAA